MPHYEPSVLIWCAWGAERGEIVDPIDQAAPGAEFLKSID
jgi:hypothetical protein